MITGSSIELIWHFAGYMHLTQDYVASRVRLDEINYDYRQYDFKLTADQHIARSEAPSDVASHGIRVKYEPGNDESPDIKWVELTDHNSVVVSASHAPDVYVGTFPKFVDIKLDIDALAGPPNEVVQHVSQAPNPSETQTPQGTAQAAPSYQVQYTDNGNDTVANLSQANVGADRDYYSDGGPEFDVLAHAPSDQPIAELLAALEKLNSTTSLPLGESVEHWTSAIVDRHESIASGDLEVQPIQPGTYLNGEFQPLKTFVATSPAVEAPPLPQPPAVVAATIPAAEQPTADARTEPGQVAETGGNDLLNAGLIADLDEAPATLVVGGDYFETNAILQTNILQNHDVMLHTGEAPPMLDSSGSTLDNVANFIFEEIVKQYGHQRGSVSNLQVDVDYVDGDVMDVKSLTQHNYFEDGDVTVQTRYDNYSEIHTGGNDQASVARFADWGKHYDVIIVLGDYHSANVISQTNIIFDNDLIGMSSASDRGASVFSGQNSLENDATIHKLGAISFGRIGNDLDSLLDDLYERNEPDHDAWSEFYGSGSGHLTVLFVTGNYYDLNVISQINVLADADLAVQTGSDGIRWLSTGGNTAHNEASIVNAGGIYEQHLGGDLYEDSILVQANLISDASETIATDPTALVSELVAFMEHCQEDLNTDSAGWTRDIFGHSDSFGHVLT